VEKCIFCSTTTGELIKVTPEVAGQIFVDEDNVACTDVEACKARMWKQEQSWWRVIPRSEVVQ